MEILAAYSGQHIEGSDKSFVLRTMNKNDMDPLYTVVVRYFKDFDLNRQLDMFSEHMLGEYGFCPKCVLIDRLDYVIAVYDLRS